ncbi:MAG: hydrolase 1, exosortase A system-associated [Methylomicrobium sp.]|nr:hydrolase 1, exosortase A system-associated [Methylomicrobium sp.]
MANGMNEIPVAFSCGGDALLGMIHLPVDGKTDKTLGVLVVVGGPQYRAGSHRQFLLLSRYLAESGIPVMRFDYRGMGDSEGEMGSFADIDDDIRAAIDCFYENHPDLSGIVLWGLCDAASASLFYGYQDDRVKGMVLLNPWVFTEQGSAKTYLKHYYFKRLFSPDFWRKILSLQFNYAQSLRSLFGFLKSAGRNSAPVSSEQIQARELVDPALSLPVRMRECLSRFDKPVLLILSGRDLTADEFKEAVKSDTQWQALVSDANVTTFEMLAADHTFSSAILKDQVAEQTLKWVESL